MNGASAIITPTTGLLTADATQTELIILDGAYWNSAMFICEWLTVTLGNASDEGDVYVQSFVEGVWYDLCNFHAVNGDNGTPFNEAHTIVVPDANSGIVALTDGAVADDTCTADALLGTKYRTKFDITVGAATPGCSFRVSAVFKR
jgi:hypothetical protein